MPKHEMELIEKRLKLATADYESWMKEADDESASEQQ